MPTPFSRKKNLSRSEKRFNSKLIGTRVIVEQAYEDFKNRFRQLNDVIASIKRSVFVFHSQRMYSKRKFFNRSAKIPHSLRREYTPT